MIDCYEEMSNSGELRGDGEDKQLEGMLQPFTSVVGLQFPL